MKKKQAQMTGEPYRRLSPWRVLLGIIGLAVIVSGVTFGAQWWRANQASAATKPWFAAYVDVTSTPIFPFDQIGTLKSRDAILSFVVASKDDPCIPAWGGEYTVDEAQSALDLDRRIARLQQQGGHIAVSFGGLNNNELAVSCSDSDKLVAAYKSVINHYSVDTIDLDLENKGLTDAEAGARRATVIAKLQSEQRSHGKKLAVWVTLPVTPQGLSTDGTNAISQLLKSRVDLAGINVMTMDYGASRPTGQSMANASEDALIQAERQLGILYDQVGLHQNDANLWRKIGATPMIGQNDVVKEVFTGQDATNLNQFALSHGLGRMSMWSANRDVPCGANYVDLTIVSDSCSGVTDEKWGFMKALSQGFAGNISSSASLVTTKDVASTVQTPDDPAKSPYQIWSSTGVYLQGTKVVWHHNVYRAKWWTKNDVPDSPVLQAYQTPWELVGPVLPGEKPVKQATLPAGTYPNWSGMVAYDTEQRVLFNGVPYQAKWWNKGESPAAASSNPDSSPWVALTQAEIDAIIKKSK